MNVIKIAWRNLLRYRRRTILTGTLIAVGVLLVIAFGGIGSAFKDQVIQSITNTSLGDIEIHRKGYVSSIDNLPLNITIPGQALPAVESLLKNAPNVKAYSERLRFGAMISNYSETTSMSLIAVNPSQESATCPGLLQNIKGGTTSPDSFVRPGWILVPDNVAAGLGLTVGSDVVLVATNKDGSVNGLNLRVSAITANVFGPQARFGYMDMADARTLLRIDNGEINEIAVALNNFNDLQTTYSQLRAELSRLKGPQTSNSPAAGQSAANAQTGTGTPTPSNPTAGGSSPFEIHTWQQLSPFATIASIVTLLIMVIRVVLIFIVLVSVLNVMVMSVYERIGEIGTIASIGTLPSKILALFLTEGVVLGLVSSVVASLVGIGVLDLIKAMKIHFMFGKTVLVLSPQTTIAEVLLTILMVVATSVLASLQPAVKAARMEPVDALRHV